jgi:hypothetical protein
VVNLIQLQRLSTGELIMPVLCLRRTMLKPVLMAAALIGALAFTTVASQAADPLPSWNDGPAKQSIIAFVERVTKPGSPDFVPVPIGRKMTRPTTLSLTDRNGTPHECVAEAFDTTYNVIILLYPVKALGNPTIILPAGFKQVV